MSRGRTTIGVYVHVKVGDVKRFRVVAILNPNTSTPNIRFMKHPTLNYKSRHALLRAVESGTHAYRDRVCYS